MADLALDDEQADFVREFGVYQLEGRYPDAEQIDLDESFARSELDKVKELFEWLIGLL